MATTTGIYDLGLDKTAASYVQSDAADVYRARGIRLS